MPARGRRGPGRSRNYISVQYRDFWKIDEFRLLYTLLYRSNVYICIYICAHSLFFFSTHLEGVCLDLMHKYIDEYIY